MLIKTNLTYFAEDRPSHNNRTTIEAESPHEVAETLDEQLDQPTEVIGPQEFDGVEKYLLTAYTSENRENMVTQHEFRELTALWTTSTFLDREQSSIQSWVEQ